MGSDKKSIAVAAELNLKLMQAKNKKMKCKKENYFYLKGSGIDFRSQLKFVLEKYIPVFSTIRLVFFFEAESDDDFATCQYEIRKEMVRKFGKCCPVWSCVAQSPLEEGCKLAVEVQEIELEKNDIILYKAYLKFPYVVVESPQSKRLFLGGIAKKASSKSILLQAEYIFTIIESILEIEKMPISSIVRQWNYIQAITKIDCEHQHYQDFNDARTIFYNKTTWDDGYPAATGIGTSFGGLVIDLEAVLPKGSKVKIRGIDNKLQIPAFDYSQKVLLGKGDEKLRAKSTPKFERAKAVIDNKVGLLYISGTAAIKGETCLGEVDLKEQTLATLENISHLLLPQTLEEAGIDYGCDIRLISLRVYLKKKSFYEDVKKIIDKEYINLEIIYLLADVCRDELLIEIEAMASIGIEA